MPERFDNIICPVKPCNLELRLTDNGYSQLPVRRLIHVVYFMVIVVAGCSATPTRAPLEDIAYLKPDCYNKDLQVRYLQSQLGLTSSYHSFRNLTELLGGLGESFNGSAQELQKRFDRKYNAVAKEKIWDIRAACP
jgi:hypothetical protein